jgi:hypothetical protein
VGITAGSRGEVNGEKRPVTRDMMMTMMMMVVVMTATTTRTTQMVNSFSPKRPIRIWAPVRLLIYECRALLPQRQSGRSVKLAANFICAEVKNEGIHTACSFNACAATSLPLL